MFPPAAETSPLSIHVAKLGGEDPDAYARMRENFLQLRYEEDPTILIDELVGLASSVSEEKPTRLPFRSHSSAPFTGIL